MQPSLVISAVRLGVGLAEFEHAKIAVRRPAHGKMLARGLRIAQTSLQRIAVKQGTATRLSVATLARLHGGLNAATAALGFSSVNVLEGAIMTYCEGSDQVDSSLP